MPYRLQNILNFICHQFHTKFGEKCMDNKFENQSKCLIRTLERLSKAKVAIPLIFFTKKGELFNIVTNYKFYSCVNSPFFTIKKFEKKTGCMVLSILIPIDIEGCPVDLCSDLYSLLVTGFFVKVDINCLCGIIQIPVDFINRYIPVIEPKC